ncbi:MAG: hypothetical protein QXW47_03040 [Candidatus Jordarchaeales archaeon]
MLLKKRMIDIMMPREFGAVSGLFHAAIFTLQEKMIELIGRGGLRDYVFPAVHESIINVEKLGLKPLKGESFEEVLSELTRLLKKSLLISSAQFIKKDDDTYVFILNGCFMARSAHTVAQVKGVCPMAMVAAAIMQKYSGREVAVEWSKLTEKGSETEIKLL